MWKEEYMKPNFDIELLPDAALFIEQLEEKTRDKVLYCLRKVQYINDKELFKKLNDHIWEFRILYDNKSYRLFAFWSKTEKTIVVATHGILKKTQKTPLKEIRKAEEIRKQYIERRTK